MSYKIKKDGLIWKLHKEFNSEVYNKLCDDKPVGLCLFFWNTLLQVFKFLGMCIASLFAIGLCLVALWGVLSWAVGLVLAAFGILLPFINYHWVAVATGSILVLGTLFILAELFLKLIGSDSATLDIAPKYLTNLLPEKKEVVKDKPQGLAVSYWKAFKGKICPIVEVKE